MALALPEIQTSLAGEPQAHTGRLKRSVPPCLCSRQEEVQLRDQQQQQKKKSRARLL